MVITPDSNPHPCARYTEFTEPCPIPPWVFYAPWNVGVETLKSTPPHVPGLQILSNLRVSCHLLCPRISGTALWCDRDDPSPLCIFSDMSPIMWAMKCASRNPEGLADVSLLAGVRP